MTDNLSTASILTEARTMSFVATTQPAEAKRFYGEVLGLRFLHEDQFGMMFAVHKDMTLRVQRLRELTPQQFTVMGWQVDDMESAVVSLTKRGVKFEVYGFPTQDDRGINRFDNGDKVAWFKDPDGNTLSIAQLAK